MASKEILKAIYRKPVVTIILFCLFGLFILLILKMGYNISIGNINVNNSNNTNKEIVAEPLPTAENKEPQKVNTKVESEKINRNYKKEIKELEKLLVTGQYGRAYRESLEYFDSLPPHYKVNAEHIIEEAEDKYDNGKFPEASRILVNELKEQLLTN